MQVPLQWPKHEIDSLTPAEYQTLMSENLVVNAHDLCQMFLKMKAILRSLQVDGVIGPQHTVFGETMINEFITHVRNVAQTPAQNMNADQIVARLFAFTIKSGMTPGSVVSFERRQQGEYLN